jgi:hypothetical protein
VIDQTGGQVFLIGAVGAGAVAGVVLAFIGLAFAVLGRRHTD